MSNDNKKGGGGDDDPPHGHDPNVGIVVDDHKKQVRAGDWIVRDLKKKVGVEVAKVLAEITPTGLKDLEDADTITVREGQRFMSHARSGGSS